MSENAKSILLAPAGLYLLLVVALVLTLVRPHRLLDAGERARLVRLFLIGIACQCAHATEEFLTGFHSLLPPLLGLAPLSNEFFITSNLFLIGIWLLSALGVLRNVRAAYFPLWFFALGMCLNGVVHPVLAVLAAGYFPGLVTAPVVGVIGFVVARRLFQSTGKLLSRPVRSDRRQ